MTASNSQTEPVLMALEVGVRHRWRFVLSAFVVCVLVLAASLALPRKYRAEATFESRTDMVLAEIINRGVSQNFSDPRGSLAKELAGPAAVDEVIGDLRADEALRRRLKLKVEDLEPLRYELERKIIFKYEIATSNLDQVTVSLVGGGREATPWLVNRLVHNYIRRARQQTDERLKQSAEFFRKEVEGARRVIEGLESQKLAFEMQHADLLPDSANGVQSNLAQLRVELAEQEQQRESARLRIEALTESLAATPAMTPTLVTQRNPEMGRLEQELREAEGQLSNAAGTLRMTDRHPQVLALRQKIASVRARLEQTQQEIVTEQTLTANPKRAELEVLLARAQADGEAYAKGCTQLETRIAAMTNQSGDIYPVRAEYQKLTRQMEEAQRQLSFWDDNLRRVEVLRTASSGDRGISLRFLKPAAPVARAVSPRLAQVLAAAVLLALGAGILSVFLGHKMDDTFHRSADLAAALNLPILGAVSEIVSQRQLRLRRMRRMVLYPLNAAAMAAVVALMVTLVYLSLNTRGDSQRAPQPPEAVEVVKPAPGPTAEAGT